MLRFQGSILHINGVSAADLASRYGTPLYVYDAGVVQRQIERVKKAFEDMRFRPFYAMKANGAIRVLEIVRKGGFGCDAVSPGEIFIARRAGFTPEDIWFTCSNVSDDDLRLIDDPRIVINVNSVSEIDRILLLGLPNPIALRVDPAIGAGHHADVVTAGGGVKFGIDIAELEDARMLVETAGRRVVGLHSHIGSGIDDTAPLLEAARRLLDLSGSFPNLQWINFGGGFSVPYRPGDSDFPIGDYGADLTRIADPILRARNLTAIVEPGRYIVAESGLLLSRVTARRISAGQWWIGCDTGFNHLVRPSKYGAYHHILNATNGTDSSLRTSFAIEDGEDVVVAGNLCESGDVFTRDSSGTVQTRRLDRTKPGDLIAFCDVGAYGFSMASLYNARVLPAEVMIENSSARLIRERQTFEDLVRGQL